MERSKLLTILIFTVFALSFFSSQIRNNSGTSCFTNISIQNIITAEAYADETGAEKAGINESEVEATGPFSGIVGLIILIGLFAVGAYALNKWRLWIWGFKTGTADSDEFIEALKWSGITGAVLLVLFIFSWLIS